MKIVKKAAALLTAGFLLVSCGKGAVTSVKRVEEQAVAASRPVAESPSVPSGETAQETYGFVLTVGEGSVTVDLASAQGAESVTNAGELAATGVEKTISVDDNCPILDADGKAVTLSSISKGTALRITESPSVLLSIQIIPAPEEPAPKPETSSEPAGE